MRWIARCERLACLGAVVWLQVVGQVTTQVLHHVIHALPIALLLVLPRNRWVRSTCVLTGFLWIFMLSVITGMVHHALWEGGLWRYQGFFFWLAPILAAICAIWMALNLTLLSGQVARLPAFLAASLALIPALAALHPFASLAFEPPVMGVIEGRWVWVAVLAVELVALVMIPWWLIMLATGRGDLRPTARVCGTMAAYRVFFLACMVVGILPAVNP